MRLANEIAAGRDGARPGADPAGHARERGRRALGRLRPRRGHGLRGGKVELALGFSLVWSGPGIKTFTATGSRPIVGGRADALRDLGLRRRLLVRPHEEPRSRRARRPLRRARAGADGRVRRRGRVLPGRARASPSSTDGSATGSADIGYPGQPTHPICHGVGARAHEPPYAHQAGGGAIEAGMVLAIEPGCYWPDGGGLRVEDNFLITEGGAEKPLPLPRRDRERGMIDRDEGLDGRSQRAGARAAAARHRRSLRHDAARRRADRRRRALAGRQARDRAGARRSRASTGSRPASRASRPTTRRRSG